jgi:hypothetical protein
MKTIVPDLPEKINPESDNFQITLTQKIPEKFTTSCIDPELGWANCVEADFGESLEFCKGTDYQPQRTNTGRVCGDDWFLTEGGMLYRPVDPKTGKRSDWGVLKPFPVLNHFGKKEKSSPKLPKGKTQEIFTFFLPEKIQQKICAHYGVEEKPAGNFWQFAGRHGIPLVVTESPEKALCLLSMGYLSIGLNGIWGFNDTSRPKEETLIKGYEKPLHPWLQWLVEHFDAIVIAYDSDGNLQTQKAESQLAGKIAKQTEGKASIKVSRWDAGLGKGIDDVAYSHGTEKVAEIIGSAKNIATQKFLDTFTISYPIFWQDNCRYLPDLPDSGKKINAVKSAKGTGKSVFASAIVEAINQANNRGKKAIIPVVNLGHRERLSKQLSKSLKLDFVNEITDTYEWVYTKTFGCCLVIDSLCSKTRTKIDLIEDEELWDNAVLIIDEIEQVLEHLSNSSTLKGKRQECFENLSELAKRAQKIWVFDADLSDFSLNFLREITDCGKDDVAVYVNNYKRENPSKILVSTAKNPTGLIKAVCDALKSGRKIIFNTASQKKSSKFSTQNLAVFFEPIAQELGGFVEIFDSQNTGSFSLTDGSIPENCLMAICSPSLETGISITQKHFDLCVVTGHGVQSVQSAAQSSARVRYPVETWVWVPEVNCMKKLGGANSYKQAKFFAQEKLKAWQEIYPDWQLFNDDSFSALEKFYFSNISRWNLGADCYREAIAEWFVREGQTVAFTDDFEADKATGEGISAIRDSEWERLKSAVASEKNPTDKRYNQLSTKRGKTPAENIEYERGRIERTYGYCDEKIIDADKDGCYQKLKLLYYLAISPKIRDEKIMADATGKKTASKVEIAKYGVAPKVKILEKLGLAELIGSGAFTPTHPVIEAIAKCDATKFRALFDKSLPKSAMARAATVLDCIGLKAERIGRESQGGRKYIYEVKPLWDGLQWEEITAYWDGIDAEIAKNLTEKALEANFQKIVDGHSFSENNQGIEMAQNHTVQGFDANFQKIVDGHYFSENNQGIEIAQNHTVQGFDANFQKIVDGSKTPQKFQDGEIAQNHTVQGFDAVHDFSYNIYLIENTLPPQHLPTQMGGGPSPDLGGMTVDELVNVATDAAETIQGLDALDGLDAPCAEARAESEKWLSASWHRLKALISGGFSHCLPAIERLIDQFGDLISRIDPDGCSRYAF